jgi:hypothetical protein
MENRPRDEKEEKAYDKREEKSVEEKWRRDPLSAVIWAGILIWAGTALLAENLGLLDVFGIPLEAWELIFMGAGLIILLEAGIRVVIPAYRQPVLGSLIFAFILISIGLSDVVAWNFIWPIAVIAIGFFILVRGMFRR